MILNAALSLRCDAALSLRCSRIIYFSDILGLMRRCVAALWCLILNAALDAALSCCVVAALWKGMPRWMLRCDGDLIIYLTPGG